MKDDEKYLKDFLKGVRFDDRPGVSHRAELEKKLIAEYQQGSKTVLLKKTFIPLAVAAVLVIAVLLGLWIVASSPEEPTTPVAIKPDKTPTVAPVAQEDEPVVADSRDDSDKDKLLAQFTQIMGMGKAGDIDGLIAALDDDNELIRTIAANFLAQIGDEKALGALEDLIDAGELGETAEAFIAAAEKIKERLGEESQEPEVAAVKPKFTAKGPLSGLITDAGTGEPVEGATVEISVRRVFQAKTDENGFYHFDEIDQDGSFRVRVFSVEYLSVSDRDNEVRVNLSKGSEVVKHFELDRGCQVDVDVVDQEGNPVSDVRVSVSWLGDEHGRGVGQNYRLKQTDETGQLTLGAFEPSDIAYMITATHQVYPKEETPGVHHVEPRSDYAPAKHIVKFTDPETVEYAEIVMQKGVSVTGYAEYADGVPAEGLSIMPKPDWWHSTSLPSRAEIAEDGTFTLTNIAAGLYNVHIYIPKSEGGGTSFSVMQASLPLEADEVLVVRIPKKSPGSLVSISGTITFATEKRPDHISISASSAQGSSSQFVDLWSNEDTFEIGSLEPGSYTVRFSGANLETKVLKDIKAPTSDLEVELSYVEKPRLTGAVVKAAGDEPIKQFRARARKLRTLGGSNYAQSDRWSRFDNPEGSFDIEAVGPGIYQVQVVAAGFAPVWSDEINTDYNEPVLVELTQGGTIRGVVIDSEGEPIAGAMVIPLSLASGAMPRVKDVFVSEEGAVETDSEGVFVLENLSAGLETLKAVHSDYSFAIAEDIEVLEGQATEDVEIVLTSGATVEGYVYDPAGNAQPNVTLYFQDKRGYGGSGDEEAGRLGMAITDHKGYYSVTGLPEQLCYVHRSNSWSSLGVVRRAIVPVNGQSFELDFGREPAVTGRIIIDGVPLANNKITIGAVESPRSGLFRCYAMTGSDGSFSFGGVAAGSHGIYYQVPGSRRDWQKVADVRVGDDDIDLGVVPENMGSVEVSLKPADPNASLEGLQVYLQQGDEFWAPKAGQVTAPQVPSEPWIINNVLPGRYQVVAAGSDNLKIRQPIEVASDAVRAKVELTIPKGTATISGLYESDSQQPLLLWSVDKKITAHITRDTDGTYAVENLPSGEYVIGNYFMEDSAPLITFELANDESKAINLDTSSWASVEKGSLKAMVVNENGIPITGAEIWLQGASGEIEPLTYVGGIAYFVAAPGRYTMIASWPGYNTAQRNVTLQAGSIDPGSKEPPEVIRLSR